VRPSIAGLAVCLLLGACRVPLPTGEGTTAPVEGETRTVAREVAQALGEGAAPGNKDGPGGFVPRGTMRNFYAGAGGRLWYYMNNYYWAPPTACLASLWIKAEVVEEFRDLRRWPDGRSVPGPEPKRTVEYWEVGRTRRSIRLDNHKDYCLLSDQYTAGAVVIRVTLTLGHVQVRDAKGRWGYPREAYVLESRNYSGGGGIGAENARFDALQGEAVTVWGYEVPWSTHPQRLTRSTWQDLELPEWSLLERRPPPPPPPRPRRRPSVRPSDAVPDEALR